MKKLISMMVLFTALVMSVSCTKDGDYSNDDIVGTWEAVEEYGKEVEDGEVYEDSYHYDSGELFWVFKSNGTLVIVYEGAVEPDEALPPDEVLPDMPDSKSNDDVSDVIYYKVNGSKLMLTLDGDTESIDIKKLTSDELVLTQSYSEPGYSYYTEIVFRREK